MKLAYLIFASLIASNCFADDIDDINALLVDYVTSVNELDLAKAESIWSSDDAISFIHPRGHSKGWDEISSTFYLGAMANFSKRDLRLRDITIRVLSPDTAWGDFYWDFDATFNDGSPAQTTGRETQVWKKETDGWKVVHVHYSGAPVTA
jgi:ketosteroid isomerase-like protein